MIARCDGKPITWPEPTHDDPLSPAVQLGKLKSWRTAGSIIDWSIGAPSIFDRKKPLIPNTLKRIQKGLERFVINTAEPFMVSDELKAAFLFSYYTEQSEKEVRGLSLESPLHTITAGGNRFGLVTAFLTKYYGQSTAQRLSEPLHTITTKDRFALTAIKMNDYQITDIGLRMLQPHELFAGQGFPSEYQHPGTKSEQIKRVGNSVPPPFADALVRANLPEMSVEQSRFKIAAGE